MPIEKCSGGEAVSGQESKSGRFAYYVCQSGMKQGSGACDIRNLMWLVDEEMDRVAKEQPERPE